MKMTIKEIFDSENDFVNPNEENNPNLAVKDNRMMQLSKAFEQKDIVLKEDSERKVDLKKIKKEINRLKKVARIDEWNSNQYTGNIPTVLGLGQTVNTFIPKSEETVNTFINVNSNPNSNHLHNPKFSYLSDAEALRLSISRALNSGDQTVHKLGFYEEVNQTLNQLGFLSKSPLAIKEMIIKMIQK